MLLIVRDAATVLTLPIKLAIYATQSKKIAKKNIIEYFCACTYFMNKSLKNKFQDLIV